MRTLATAANDLAVTFLLMTFVIFIFAAFGMYQFGQLIGVSEATGEVVTACPSLGLCFLEFLDAGVRTRDIVKAVFEEVTWADDLMAYFGRIVFGLAFVLLVAMLFFLVTGIIVDNFRALRQGNAARVARMRARTFISDLSKDACEELQLDFDKVNGVDQDKWAYVCLRAHLALKPPTELTGPESVIAAAVARSDIDWMPERTCWAMQLKNATLTRERELEASKKKKKRSGGEGGGAGSSGSGGGAGLGDVRRLEAKLDRLTGTVGRLAAAVAQQLAARGGTGGGAGEGAGGSEDEGAGRVMGTRL